MCYTIDMSKKKKTKTIERPWQSGVNPKSPMSYERYMKSGLEIISKHFSIRTYKLAPKEEYSFFERGKDLRVQLYWKNEYIEGSEFIVELAFWLQSSRNKEDREHMRNWADVKLKACYDAVQKGKEKAEKAQKSSKKTTPKKTRKKISSKIGVTQQRFEDAKKKK